jgi:hypothetical protein
LFASPQKTRPKEVQGEEELILSRRKSPVGKGRNIKVFYNFDLHVHTRTTKMPRFRIL